MKIKMKIKNLFSREHLATERPKGRHSRRTCHPFFPLFIILLLFFFLLSSFFIIFSWKERIPTERNQMVSLWLLLMLSRTYLASCGADATGARYSAIALFALFVNIDHRFSRMKSPEELDRPLFLGISHRSTILLARWQRFFFLFLFFENNQEFVERSSSLLCPKTKMRNLAIARGGAGESSGSSRARDFFAVRRTAE